MKKAISIILFIATIPLPLATIHFASEADKPEIFMAAFFANMWIALPLSAISIASFIFGMVAGKGRIIKKNVVAGAIVTVMMIPMGISGFREEVDRTGAFLKEASSKTGIALPREAKSASYFTDEGLLGNALLDGAYENNRFEMAVKADRRWVTRLPVASLGAIPSSLWIRLPTPDYCSLFVEPISEFNPMELLPGDYYLTLLAYWPSSARLFVFDSYKVSI